MLNAHRATAWNGLSWWYLPPLLTLNLAALPEMPALQAQTVGDRAEDFELPVLAAAAWDSAPGPRRLSDLRGQVVVLSFWSTGCPTCMREFPEMERLAEEWTARGVRFYGIVPTGKHRVPGFLAERGGARFTHLAGDGALLARWGARGYPHLVIVDRDGMIAWRRIGGSPRLRTALPAELERLVAHPASGRTTGRTRFRNPYFVSYFHGTAPCSTRPTAGTRAAITWRSGPTYG
jgi:thiol-disulfide isomerase/thioredoxin